MSFVNKGVQWMRVHGSDRSQHPWRDSDTQIVL
nr:MAG TPA: hypothetical protein [Caudoviricetes sp.]